MTAKESDEYYNLPSEGREEYDHQKKKHPTWSHNQIMARVGIAMSIEKVIDKKGGAVNPQDLQNDPDFIKGILEGAKEALRNAGIYITRVFNALDEAIASIGELISNL